MLLQSQNGVVNILPALPDAWTEGAVTGLKARGNFEVDIGWEEGALKEVVVRSFSGSPLTMICADNRISISTLKGAAYRFDKELKWIK
jgi:alpha-L-fucosidase 2